MIAKLNNYPIEVFDNENISVVRNGPETIRIEGKEVTVLVRDFRTRPITGVLTFLVGALCGAGMVSLAYMLL